MHVQVISLASEGFGQSNLAVACNKRESACGRSKAGVDTIRNEIKIRVVYWISVSNYRNCRLAPPLFPHPPHVLSTSELKYNLRLKKITWKKCRLPFYYPMWLPFTWKYKACRWRLSTSFRQNKTRFSGAWKEKTRPDINNKFQEFVSATLVHLIIQHNVFYYLGVPRLKTLSQIWWVFPFSLSVIRQVSELPGARNRLPKPLVRIEGTDAPKRTF